MVSFFWFIGRILGFELYNKEGPFPSLLSHICAGFDPKSLETTPCHFEY
jgi:hypothetical protein